MINQKISDFVDLKEYPEVIQTDWALNEEMVLSLEESYILTDDLVENLYMPIFGVISNEDSYEKNSVLVIGPYGSGKSYFLLILNSLLTQMGDVDSKLWSKFLNHKNRKLKDYFDKINSKVLTVTINMVGKNGSSFNEIINNHIVNEVKRIVPDFIISTEYDEAVNALDKLSPNVKEDFSNNLKEFGVVFDDFYKRLIAQNKQALDIYYAISEKVIQRPINRNDFNPKQLVTIVLGEIKKHGYGKIVFLVDEFAQYLYICSNKTEWAITVDQIQDFIQYTNASQGEISFIGIMHQSLESLFTSKNNQVIYTKLTGRFDEIYLNRINMVNLIQGQFKTINNVKDISQSSSGMRQISVIEKLSKTYKIDEPFKSYPLAPQLLRYLPFVSRGLAQENRTTFKFIRSKFEEIKDKSIHNEKGELLLMNLDDIFDYYLPSMHIKDPNILAIFNRVKEFCDSNLSVQILKVLLVLNIVGRYYSPEDENEGNSLNQRKVIETGATVSRLQELLFVENKYEVEKACERLLDSGFVHKSLANNQLSVLPGAGITNEQINKELQEVRKNTDPDRYLFKLINENIYNLDIGKQFNINFIVARTFRGVITEYSELVEHENIYLPNGYDGHIVFAIPKTSNSDDLNLKNKVRQYAVQSTTLNLIVAVTKEFPVDKEILVNHEAYQLIKGKFAENEHAIQVINRKEAELAKTVKIQLQNLCKSINFDVYYNKQVSELSIQRIIYKSLQDYYNKFPLYNLPSDVTVTQFINGRNTTNKLINTLVVNKETLFAIDSVREEHRQILEFLMPLGLVEIKEEDGFLRACLRLPGQNSRCIETWSIIDKNITKDVSLVYDILQSPPYGIPYYIVELFISIYVKLGQADIYNKLERKYESVNQKVINDVSAKRGDKFIFYLKERLSEEELKILNLFSQTIAKILSDDNVILYSDNTIMEKSAEEQLSNHIKYFRDFLLEKYIAIINNLDIDSKAILDILVAFNTATDKSIYEYCKKHIENITKTVQIFRALVPIADSLNLDPLLYELVSIVKSSSDIVSYNKFLENQFINSDMLNKYPLLRNQYDQVLEFKKQCYNSYLIGTNRDIFINASRQFYNSFIECYIKEHEHYRTILVRITKEIESNYSYLLLKELRKLVLIEPFNPKIEGLINGELRVCGKNLQTKDIAEQVGQINCTHCDYKWGLLETKLTAKEQLKSFIIESIEDECKKHLKFVYSKLYLQLNDKSQSSLISSIETVLFGGIKPESVSLLINNLRTNLSTIQTCLQASKIDKDEKIKKYKVNKVIESFQNYCKTELKDDMELDELLLKIVKWVEMIKNL